MESSLLEIFFVIFAGAALIATLALASKQPVIVAYIIAGMILGPFGTGAIQHLELLQQASTIGVIFLLFLLGLDMQPQALISTIKKSSIVVIISSLCFFSIGFAIALLFNFSTMDAALIGIAMLFSSTIIGIKLLPTTALHHKHIGELMVGILLLQDILAITVLTVLNSTSAEQALGYELARAFIALPIMIAIALVFVRFVILPLFTKFDRFQEYLFLCAIGWCLGMAEMAEKVGLSAEIGAFIAGVTLATSPISQYLALNLKPLRDFFLVVFFFTLGAGYNTNLFSDVWVAAIALTIATLVLKPTIYRVLIRKQSESKQLSWDLGLRLGQISEFSLLICFVAVQQGILSETASTLIQTVAILTFIASSYLVTNLLTNPMASNPKRRRD